MEGWGDTINRENPAWPPLDRNANLATGSGEAPISWRSPRETA